MNFIPKARLTVFPSCAYLKDIHIYTIAFWSKNILIKKSYLIKGTSVSILRALVWSLDFIELRLETKGGGQEELPHVRGQGQRPRVPGCNSAGTAEKNYPSPRSGAAARRSYLTSEARGGGWEDQPYVQGAVAAWAQEGLEALYHVEGQEGWRWGDTPHPR